jgi:hypothetical protein
MRTPLEPHHTAFAAAEHGGCQRWRERRARYRPAGEPIDPRRHAVDRIEERDARRFVETHHYSGSWPATRLSIGLMRRGRSGFYLAGVAAFSVPMTNAVLQHHLGVGLDHGIELGRLVLLDEVEANAESWMVARALRQARAILGVSRVLGFCDPVERTDQDGNVRKRGHIGTVYRATNAEPAGRSGPRTLWLLPTGAVLSGRAASKLRRGERGIDYVLRQLGAAGAPPRDIGEDGAAYLARLRATRVLRPLRHPGNLVCRWGVAATTEAA